MSQKKQRSQIENLLSDLAARMDETMKSEQIRESNVQVKILRDDDYPGFEMVHYKIAIDITVKEPKEVEKEFFEIPEDYKKMYIPKKDEKGLIINVPLFCAGCKYIDKIVATEGGTRCPYTGNVLTKRLVENDETTMTSLFSGCHLKIVKDEGPEIH